LSVFWRYWLLQIPGWIVLAGLVVAAHYWLGLSLAAGAVVVFFWLAKDAMLYPLLKPHYVFHQRHAHEALVGADAVAEQPLSPRGYVKVRGELWRAELVGSDEPVLPGESVVVESVDGLSLKVRR
jgi:membrane protein implicated in regulation of membrane protease activity